MKKLLLSIIFSTCILLISSSRALATSDTYNYTGGQQTWVVPSGVSSVDIEVWGAQGGQGYGAGGSYTGQTGGLGGYAKGTLSVTAGQTLYIYVGGAGQNGGYNIQTSGGYGGGGGGSPSNPNIASYSGGGGGGASDVRYGGNGLGNRVIVGGGGGGGGSYSNAWGGGGGYSSGANASDSSGAGTGGTGGSQASGGTGGGGGTGSLGIGGTGVSGYCEGGGGGGYYGGGSGGGSCNSSGAGGGSSYLGSLTNTTYTNSTRSGNGQVVITYTAAGGGGGGVSLRGSTTGTVSGGSSVTISVPSGTAVGDVMMAGIFANGNTTAVLGITPPSGWNLIQKVDNQSGSYYPAVAMYYHVVTGSEPASYTWNFSNYYSGAYGGGWIASYTGVDTASPIETYGGQNIGSSGATTTSYSTPTITTSVANDILVMAFAGNCATNGFNTPTSPITASIINGSINGGCTTGSGFYETKATAGSVSVPSTAKTASYGGAVIAALRPKASVTTVQSNYASYNSFNVGITATASNNSYFGARYSTSNTGNCSTWTDSGYLVWVSPGTYTNYQYTVSSGVQPSTSYYYCAYVYDTTTGSTTYGQIYSSPVTTTARPSPSVTAYSATLISDSSAVLGAGIDAKGASSTGFFRWQQTSTAPASCASMSNVTPTVSTGSYDGDLYPSIYTLSTSPGLKYYYCFQSSNGNPTPGYSAVNNFTALTAAGTSCTLFPGSTLAAPADDTTMKTWLGTSKFAGTLIYKALVNGWTAANFHSAVDGQPQVILLVKANNKVFGHYNPVGMNSSGWTAGAGAFLFNLTDNYKLNQVNYARYIFYGYSAYGPYMGNGAELAYYGGSTLNNSWVNNSNGPTYEKPSSKGAFVYLSGTASPAPVDIEVYKLSTCAVSGPTNVTTNAVDYAQVNENQAIINGAANPNNLASTGWFRYVASTSPGVCNDTFGTRLPSSGGYDLGSSGTLQPYSQQTPATLTANTTYYYCAIANNSNGTAPASNVLSFITAPPPPAFTSPLPSATVVSPGNSSISWTNTSANGAGYYSLRIWDKTLNPDPPSTPPGTGYGSNYPGGLSALCAANAANTTNDVCYNTPNASTTTYSYTFTAGHTYQIWVHSRNSTTGAWSSAGPSTSNMITVTANYPLNVSKTLGTGTSASVTSLDGFINCGATCGYSYTTNASVKLTAVPDGVTQLNGWSGVICTGAGESQTTDTCTFNVGDISGSNGTVTANFIKKTFVLTAAINGGAAGLGSGTVQTLTSVSGSPDGFINCGSTCAHTYDINTTVYLKETPDSTATFAGWSGISCLGGDQTAEVCAVYMDAAKTATANFNSIGYTGDATFYFGTPGQTCNPGNAANTTPALEVVIITGSTASPTVSKYFFDPCNRVGGSTGIVTALDSTTGLYQGVTFAYKATVPAISHGLIMKVIPLYNSSKVGVKGTDIFPPQGKVIQSTGSSGDSARKVIYYESYPQIPNEIFPYSILSQ